MRCPIEFRKIFRLDSHEPTKKDGESTWWDSVHYGTEDNDEGTTSRLNVGVAAQLKASITPGRQGGNELLPRHDAFDFCFDGDLHVGQFNVPLV